MKKCNVCDQVFEDEFSFCPLDATPLHKLVAGSKSVPAFMRTGWESVISASGPVGMPSARDEFHLTLIDNSSLLERLTREIRFLGYETKQAWPALKKDPVGFARDVIAAGKLRLRRMLAAPNSLAALMIALLLMLSAAMVLVISGGLGTENENVERTRDEPEQVITFLPERSADRKELGIGAGGRGQVGLATGKGEGSGPKPKKSTGGGTGGQHDPLPAQVGKVPPPSEIPAPIPKFPPVQKQSLAVAGIDIDPALWKSLPMANYGDPRSKSSAPSNGPGDGGGMGTASGTGIGEGSGPGFGPGQDGNVGGDRKGLGCCGPGGSQGSNPDPDRVYPATLVSERARVLMKPEPQYTEDARRNQITGSVVLRVVFSRDGAVTNIRAIHALPFGLTERAIAAARQIRFRPATKDGRPVNVYMQLEYNFNLY
jgi:TonB family protein